MGVLPGVLTPGNNRHSERSRLNVAASEYFTRRGPACQHRRCVFEFFAGRLCSRCGKPDEKNDSGGGAESVVDQGERRRRAASRRPGPPVAGGAATSPDFTRLPRH